MNGTTITPALKPIPFPAINSDDQVQLDLVALWNAIVKMKRGQFETLDDQNDLLPGSAHPDAQNVDTQARQIFAEHPAGKTDPDEGRIIQQKLRSLLGFPLSLPVSYDDSDDLPLLGTLPLEAAPAQVAMPVPIAAAAAVVAAEPSPAEPAPEPVYAEPTAPEETLDPEAEADQDDEEDGEESTSTEAASVEESDLPVETPGTASVEVQEVLLSSEVTAWAEGHVGNGLLSGLAKTMNRGEVMQLVILRRDDKTLQVSIETRKIEGEQGEPHPGLNITGTPLELDEGLLNSMPIFTQARQTVRDAATAYLQSVARTAAATAKKSAEAKAAGAAKTTRPAPTTKPGQAKSKPATPAAQPATRTAPSVTPTLPAANVPQPPQVTGVQLSITNPGLDPKAVTVIVKRAGQPDEQLTAADLKARPYPAGRLTLEITADGFKPNYMYPILKEGEVTHVNVTLTATEQPNLMSAPPTQLFQPSTAS